MHGRGGRRQSGESEIARAGAAVAAAVVLFGCNSEPERQEVSANEVSAALARVEVRPGLWVASSRIVSVSQQDLPVEIAERMKARRRSFRHCITPEQAARPDANFLAARSGGRCSDQSFEMRGGRIAGSMVCREESGAETRVRTSGSYGPEAYEMSMEMETPGLGEGRVMTIVTRQEGRRVGACPAEGQQAAGEKKK